MEKLLSLNEEIDVLIKIKSSVCECNPCTCSEKKKDKYFQELKDVLAASNQHYLANHLTRIRFFNQPNNPNSIILF